MSDPIVTEDDKLLRDLKDMMSVLPPDSLAKIMECYSHMVDVARRYGVAGAYATALLSGHTLVAGGIIKAVRNKEGK